MTITQIANLWTARASNINWNRKCWVSVFFYANAGATADVALASHDGGLVAYSAVQDAYESLVVGEGPYLRAWQFIFDMSPVSDRDATVRAGNSMAFTLSGTLAACYFNVFSKRHFQLSPIEDFSFSNPIVSPNNSLPLLETPNPVPSLPNYYATGLGPQGQWGGIVNYPAAGTMGMRFEPRRILTAAKTDTLLSALNKFTYCLYPSAYAYGIRKCRVGDSLYFNNTVPSMQSWGSLLGGPPPVLSTLGTPDTATGAIYKW